MFTIVTALDHYEPARYLGRQPDGSLPLRWRARYYLDAGGHAWRVRPYNATCYERWHLDHPGEFATAERAAEHHRYLARAFQEPGRSDAERARAHLARWRILGIEADHGAYRTGPEGEEGAATGPEARFDLLELARLPPHEDPAEALRPLDLASFRLADATPALRAYAARLDEGARAWRSWRRRDPRASWVDRPGLLRCVKPSKTTRTLSAHYAERAGRWRRVDDPAASPPAGGEVWARRDTVEVIVRVGDPRVALALYKRRGRVGDFRQDLGCELYHAGETGRRRWCAAPPQEAAALRALLRRARRDLAPELFEARRGRGGGTAAPSGAIPSQVSLF